MGEDGKERTRFTRQGGRRLKGKKKNVRRTEEGDARCIQEGKDNGRIERERIRNLLTIEVQKTQEEAISSVFSFPFLLSSFRTSFSALTSYAVQIQVKVIYLSREQMDSTASDSAAFLLLFSFSRPRLSPPAGEEEEKEEKK